MKKSKDTFIVFNTISQAINYTKRCNKKHSYYFNEGCGCCSSQLNYYFCTKTNRVIANYSSETRGELSGTIKIIGRVKNALVSRVKATTAS